MQSGIGEANGSLSKTTVQAIDFAEPASKHESRPPTSAATTLAAPGHGLEPWDFSALREVLGSPSPEPLNLQNGLKILVSHPESIATDGIQLLVRRPGALEPFPARVESTTDESSNEKPKASIIKARSSTVATPQRPNTKRNLLSAKTVASKLSQHDQSTTPAKNGKPGANHNLSGLHGRDKVERDLAFRLKLIQHFPEDRLSIARNIALQHHPGARPLHIFIDYSNMFIGYQTFLQRHGMRVNTGAQHSRLCIESLVFLLERGRIVERRHLAGSKPWHSSFATAERTGYNCTILDKVAKPFYTTSSGTLQRGRPRSAEFQKRGPWHVDEPTSSTQYGSSPEKSVTKYVEQGVDEILQLKMSLSIIDLKRVDHKTMVLATGDGAEAEYSDGFASMVERALDDGWYVELVSWEHCTSSVYNKKQWLAQWAPGQFRIIALDPFVKELQECL